MGRIWSPGKYVARPAWYDRNPTPINAWYEADTTPHAETERWTYTVPAGKKGFVEFLSLYARRYLVATALLAAFGIIYYRPSGGTERKLTQVYLYDNTLGKETSQVIGQGITMGPGDRIRGTTLDNSTGGGITFFLTMKGTEFDA